ncbi:MAG: hypothetical protein ACYC0V_20460 [Armatimonadota bacterium]
MQIAFGVIMLIFVLFFAVGWIALLINGIVRLRRGRRKQGIIMTSIGGVWGLIAIVGIVAMTIQTRSTLKELEETPFDSLTYAGPKGDISIPYKGEARLVVGNKETKKFLALESSDGIFGVPVGSYDISRYEVIAIRDVNSYYYAICYFGRGIQKSISVRTNDRTKLDIGPPLTAFVEVEKTDADSIKLRLLIVDSAGYKYRLKSPVFKPRFMIVDASGKTIREGDLKNDHMGSYVFSGDIPSSVKGDLIIKPVIPKMLFKVIIKETRITLQ